MKLNLYEEKKPQAPAIFDLQELEEAVPKGFNAVSLKGSPQHIRAAERFAKEGYNLFWRLEEGYDAGVYAFEEVTIGCSLYSGAPKEEYAKERELAEEQSLSLNCFFLLDVAEMSQEAQAIALGRARLEGFSLLVKGAKVAMSGWLWEEGCGGGVGFFGRELREPLVSVEEKKSSVALCLPPTCTPFFKEVFSYCHVFETPCRLIAEPLLAAEWEGVETLIVLSDTLGDVGVRMVKGFAASQGVVVTAGKKLGVDGELSFEKWRGIE